MICKLINTSNLARARFVEPNQGNLSADWLAPIGANQSAERRAGERGSEDLGPKWSLYAGAQALSFVYIGLAARWLARPDIIKWLISVVVN